MLIFIQELHFEKLPKRIHPTLAMLFNQIKIKNRKKKMIEIQKKNRLLPAARTDACASLAAPSIIVKHNN